MKRKSTDPKTVEDEFDRVSKKQKLITTKYRQVIDLVDDEIKKAITDLQSADYTSHVDHKSVIEHLREKLNSYRIHEQLKNSRKDLNVDLSNYPEILGQLAETDISKAYRNVEFDSHIVNQIILNLFYHEGLFDVADIFINESQEPDIISVRRQFSEMHQIVDALKARNVEPALNWVMVNRQKLDHMTGSWLEFDLRRLQYLNLLEQNQSMEALNFAKTYLLPLATHNWYQFLNLMGCLLWPGSKLKTSRYSYLLSPEVWELVSQELMLEFCGSMGMFLKNPLAVTVDAGAKALPTFLEFANMAVNREELAGMREFPVAVELGREFQFHSVFVCPVNWERNNENNVVVMLPCGHVIGSRALMYLSNNDTQMFRCPTCRHLDISVGHGRRLYF